MLNSRRSIALRQISPTQVCNAVSEVGRHREAAFGALQLAMSKTVGLQLRGIDGEYQSTLLHV
jgi:hypothetical protein